MTYVVSNTDGSLTLAIEDNTINGTDYAVVLLGKNVIDYGRYFAQNSIRQLENFAGAAPPSAGTTLIGQLWFDKTTNTLKVYSGSWKPVSTQHAQVDKIINYTSINALPPNANIQYAGAVFNNVDKKLYIDNGTRIQVAGYGGEVTSRYSTNTVLGRPNNYGTRVRTIYLTDTANVPRAVLAMVYVNDTANGSMNRGTTTTRWGKETLMMIMSDHKDFVVQNAPSYTEGEDINYYPELSDSNGIGTTISRGSNIRRDYGTSTELANKAHRANVAYNLDVTGTFDGAVGTILPASDFIHVGRGYNPIIPTATLGNQTQKFASGYINDLHTFTLTVGDAGVGTGYVLPTVRGLPDQVLTTNGAGVTTWKTVSGGGGGVTSLTAGAGLSGTATTGTVTLNVGAGTGITVGTDTVGVNTTWLAGYVGTSAPAPGTLTVRDEGTLLTGSATSVNFVGAGVTATASGAAVTVTIPGGITIPGSSGELLYNNSGALGALSTLTYTAGTPNTFALSGNLNITRNGATTNGAINFGSGNRYLKFENSIFTMDAPLLINNSGANEGGEIRLQKPTSGSALSSDLIIDLYQNRIRFFDNGGTNKGMFADITACANNVGSEIVHSTNFNSFFDTRLASTTGLPPGPRAYGTVNTNGDISSFTTGNPSPGFTVTQGATGTMIVTMTPAAGAGMINANKMIILATPHTSLNYLTTLSVDQIKPTDSLGSASFNVYTGYGGNGDKWNLAFLKFTLLVYYADDFH